MTCTLLTPEGGREGGREGGSDVVCMYNVYPHLRDGDFLLSPSIIFQYR